MWPQILEVPPEIWAEVASLSGRQSVARLAAVSPSFYSIFSGMLYAEMATGLTGEQNGLFWRTLCELPSSLKFNVHPVRLIHSLRGMDYSEIPLAQRLDGLRNLVAMSTTMFSGQLIQGAALRVLKWTAEGADELVGILSQPGHFPNLKELSVVCYVETGTSFDFIRVRDLESLECILYFTRDGLQKAKFWGALKRTLGVLPLSSPLLHSLRLRLTLRAYCEQDYDVPLWDMDADLIAGINQLRFSALTSFEFTLQASSFRLADPAMDFSLLLLGNPLLTSVALNITGICVPPNVVDASFLPCLRSFSGSAKNVAAISAHAPSLRNITIHIPKPGTDIQHQYYPDQFTSTFFPPNTNRGVTSLDVREVDLLGLLGRYPTSLNPDSLSCLVAAFPNLTHLDVSLSRSIRHYHFTALRGLQHLGVRLHKRVRLTDHARRAADIFPAEKYETDINNALLSLAQLLDVHILLWGDRSPGPMGCSSCEEDQWEFVRIPDLLVEYRFGRETKEQEFNLIEMTTLGDNAESLDEVARDRLSRRAQDFGGGVLPRRRRRY